MITILRRPIVKRCPYVGEIDAGELVITIPGEAPELHNLAEQIDKLTAEPVSHEEFTAAVADMLPGARVVTRWHTSPWEVEVEVEVAGGAVLREPDESGG